ncbi:lamin tail domain-containing protein [Algibacter sp. 2305UL17-15]|uniref:lamin tail domain-containing protein n=1 Tax=Algibacter sp. 2305UL17-15 TaxID=3231268 RepID=UPI00345A497C
MNTIPLFKTLCTCLCFMLLATSCETDDILPSIALTSDNTSLSEDNGTIRISVSLNAPATQQIIVPLNISGTATASSDYTLSNSGITISKGEDTGSITITGVQDDNVEGVETLIVSLGNVQHVLVLSSAITSITIDVLDDDSDTDSDGVLDANDDCPNDPGEVENKGCPFLGFLINEVLYDPAGDITGDANGDGTRDANDDEFIEFFNSGPELDLSGYTISDASSLRHTFPNGTIIPANGVLVLFGGGTPTGSFGGAIVQTASEGQINMSNSGDLVTLADPSGTEILTFDVEPLSNNPNESYTRNPDLTGEFEQHAGIAEANGALFSPGTKLDGSPF